MVSLHSPLNSEAPKFKSMSRLIYNAWIFKISLRTHDARYLLV